MSRRSSATLQKRLSELESELSDAFQLRLGPHSDATRKISRRLQKRLGYISKLLSAEAAASTPDKTYQLREFVEKLTQLEAVFLWWNEHPTNAIQNYLQDDDDDDNHHHSDSPQEEDSGGIWARFCKLCGAFGGGVIVGAVGCISIINFYSLYIWEWDYQHIYVIHPT